VKVASAVARSNTEWRQHLPEWREQWLSLVKVASAVARSNTEWRQQWRSLVKVELATR